jgi:thiol-disulfide isomerase/thioredoxin
VQLINIVRLDGFVHQIRHNANLQTVSSQFADRHSDKNLHMKKILSLKIFCCLTATSFGQLTIHQVGLKDNKYPELIIADYSDSTYTKINDSTILFTCNPKDNECLFIGIDRQTRWFTRIWLKPNYKQKDLVINYSKRTAKIKSPDEWDEITEKAISYGQQGNQTAEDSISFAYLQKHPDSYLSLWFLSHGLFRDNPNKKLTALKMLSPSLKEYPEYKQTEASLTQRKIPNIGDIFKEFQLFDKNGLIFNSNIIKNKWILINLWSNGCGPCVREMDALVSFYKSIDTSKAEFISISLDDKKENWKIATATNKIIWPSVWQDGGIYGDLCLNYNLMAMPFFVLFDSSKKIYYIKDGANELENIKATFKEKGLFK